MTESRPARVAGAQWLTLAALLALGILFTLLNRHLPIVRNALEYAKAALEISEHHFNLIEVVHERSWSSGKPVLFGLLAAPFVPLLGAGAATLVASCIGTGFFLWMTVLALARLNRHSGLDPANAPLELALVALNPLVLYQFWSAYPDSLFAGMVLLVFNLTDHIAVNPQRDTRWHIVALAVTIDVAIHTKLYGAVLIPASLLYFLLHGRNLATGSSYSRSKLLVLCVMFGALGADLGAAALRVNPLLDLADSAGVGGYKSGLLDGALRDILASLAMLSFAALLVFQVTLPFLAARAGRRAWRLAPAAFVAIYVLGLLTFPGTYYNMRYFLPAFPFLAVPVAAGLKSLSAVPRKTVLATFGVLATLLVLVYNVAEVEERVQPAVVAVAGQGGPVTAWLDDWLDNLRLPSQIELMKQMQAVNTEVPGGSVLYWASDYNKTASHGLAEQLGVRPGFEVRYVLHAATIQPSADPLFLTEFTSYPPRDRLSQTPRWATAQSLGHGVFRLDPISAELVSGSGDYIATPGPIELQAHVTTLGSALKVNTVKFLEADKLLGEAHEQPYTVSWDNPSPGRHQVQALVSYGKGDVLIPQPIVVYVGVSAFERMAGSATGVAAERNTGQIEYVDEALDLTARGSTVGVRFDRVQVSSGLQVADTYLQLAVAGHDAPPTELVIQAELAASAAPLGPDNGDLTQRRRTTAKVLWHPKTGADSADWQRSPSLAPLLEEVLAQPQWRPGNAVVLLIRGCGRRAGHIPDRSQYQAPRLYVELRQDDGARTAGLIPTERQ